MKITSKELSTNIDDEGYMSSDSNQDYEIEDEMDNVNPQGISMTSFISQIWNN